jgi:hypothetical protein
LTSLFESPQRIESRPNFVPDIFGLEELRHRFSCCVSRHFAFFARLLAIESTPLPLLKVANARQALVKFVNRTVESAILLRVVPSFDPFSELPSGQFFRWLSLNRWRAIVDQKQSGNTLVELNRCAVGVGERVGVGPRLVGYESHPLVGSGCVD